MALIKAPTSIHQNIEDAENRPIRKFILKKLLFFWSELKIVNKKKIIKKLLVDIEVDP